MNVCEVHKGAIVVYQGWGCPMCELGKDLDSSIADVHKLDEEVVTLEAKVLERDDKIAELEAANQEQRKC